MANWKELGEVPDSDDEGLDSQEYGSERTILAPALTPPPRIDHDSKVQDDVWNIPESSQESVSLISAGAGPGPNPQSVLADTTTAILEAASGDGSDAVDQTASSQAAESTQPEPGSLPNTEVLISTEGLKESPFGGVAAQSSPLSSLSQSPEPDATSTRPEGEHTNVSPSRRTALRLERSLRPRKPIQEHPYLLESAHYNNFMKSHGVRPIRVAPRPERTSVAREGDDSQEQEYVADSSPQELVERIFELDDLNPTRLIQSLNDRDELAPSPSPEVASPHLRTMTSSLQSQATLTDDTSLPGDDEFPSLDDLVRKPLDAHHSVSKKRSASNISLKRQHHNSIPNQSLPKGGKSSSTGVCASTNPPLQRGRGMPHASFSLIKPLRDPFEDSDLDQLHPSRSPIPVKFVIDLERSDANDDVHPIEGTDTSTSESEPEMDVIRRNGKRIRGVLPASWLRLDQHKSNDSTRRKVQKRSPEPTPERVPRRGVALPRPDTLGHDFRPFPSTPFFFDDSEDSDHATPNRAIGRATTDVSDDGRDIVARDEFVFDFGDGGSVVEEDVVNAMLPARKRRGSSTHLEPRPAKKSKKSHSSVFKGQPGQRTRQLKITQHLNRASTASAHVNHHGQQDRSNPRTRKIKPKTQSSTTRPPKPPKLSILDLVRHDAPQFIKIAARTARLRAGLGRSSLSRKYINLGTRKDNLDVFSVLRDWKSGNIKPRITGPAPKPGPSHQRRPLQQLSANTTSRHNTLDPRADTGSQKLVRWTSSGHLGDHSSKKAHAARSWRTAKTDSANRQSKPDTRPAQLEAVEDADNTATQFRFGARKRALDALYKKTQKVSRELPDVHIEHFLENGVLHTPSEVPKQMHPPNIVDRAQRKPTGRKRQKPTRLDTSAPRFAHAMDPISLNLSNESVVEVRREPDRLMGLGPFGTHYTQHFEMFPLDPGIFFHETTILGNGLLEEVITTTFTLKLMRHRQPISFHFDDQILRWSSWDESTSSQLGILVDWIGETVGNSDQYGKTEKGKARSATDFILNYIRHSLCFPTEDAIGSFALRVTDVLDGLTDRLKSAISGDLPQPYNNDLKLAQIEVMSRFLLAVLAVQEISRASATSLSYAFRIEDVIRKIATLCAKLLLDFGLEDVRTAYDTLHDLACQERGIREPQVILTGWVALMRVLSTAQIPRCGFWDITYSVLISPGLSRCFDAKEFEKVWMSMSTLLPLGEFDNSGVVIGGLRRRSPIEGWALPVQILRHVFNIYKQNPRQAPSFNEYCRALVARCHYLVQEWGWRNCNGIIGVIFDFFGSQNLAHLRNEEAHKSPRFLDQLPCHPALTIEPEDRCFHVFIKLLGTTIIQLKSLGMTNQIRNLIARTLPNHDRQYLKEETINQSDLSALRNHHDLLCTLFWAAPVELRPSLQLIEKLVMPGSSHKEACLINLRAWKQLASFVITSSEEPVGYRQFISWQNNVFQQILDQYLSAESDIQKQFSSLSRDATRDISVSVMQDVIGRNKAASMDVLSFAVRSSLDVLRQAPSLKSATCCLNTIQLEQVFTKLDIFSSGFDWTIMMAAVEMVKLYLDKVDKALDEQYSHDSSGVDPCHTEEAVMLLDHKLAKGLLSMACALTSKDPPSHRIESEQHQACAEKAVRVCARLATRLVHAGAVRLAKFFTPGAYCLFEKMPRYLGLPQRRYLPLFVGILVKNSIFDFKDIGSSALELWMTSIAKPWRHLAYENYLGEMLKMHDLPFVSRARVPVEIRPTYDTDRDLFAYAVSFMRKVLREANGSQRQQLRTDYAKILRNVMQQIRDDLRWMQSDPHEHGAFVNFVREIIALVKSHGADICPIDPFFTQVSAEFAPSAEDPKLQTAGIIAYGIRLSEGEVTAIPQLFYYLYNNFKIAVANNKLDEETLIIEKALAHDEVLSFILSKMLPAIIRAAQTESQVWPLLEMYCNALQQYLTRSCLPSFMDDDRLADMMTLLVAFLEHLTFLSQQTAGPGMSLAQVHTCTCLMRVVNALQPILSACSWVADMVPISSAAPSVVGAICDFAHHAEKHLAEIRVPSHHTAVREQTLRAERLLDGVRPFERVDAPGLRLNSAQIDQFSKHVALDMNKVMVVTDRRICVKMPAKPASLSATQPGEGVGYGPWTLEELLSRLRGQVRLWRLKPELRTTRLARIRTRRMQVFGQFGL